MPKRVQCAFVSCGETEDITNYLKTFYDECAYDQNVIGAMKREADKYTSSVRLEIEDEDDEPISGFFSDEKFLDAVDIAIRTGKVSTSLLQRKLYIGYGKAAKYIDVMEELGVISEHCGQKPRNVLISLDEWGEILSRNGNDD
jgi:S-DNA-T family DNA segregation ATPase FtsK/SpoIIIE